MDPEEKLRLAADPTTPSEVLARMVREEGYRSEHQKAFLLAIENPALPFDSWSKHLRLARAWNNPSAVLYVGAGMVTTPCSVLIEHLAARRISTMQGRGTPFTPFAEQLLKDQLDSRLRGVVQPRFWGVDTTRAKHVCKALRKKAAAARREARNLCKEGEETDDPCQPGP